MNVFLDLDFFADCHLIEGERITCILDEITGQSNAPELGIAETTHILYAATEDLPRRRGYGNGIDIDDRQYLVIDWKEEMGISVVQLRSSEVM